jgi:hypothetical protein
VVDPFDSPAYPVAARLDLDVVRANPVGARMGKVIAKLDPLSSLKTAASGIDPLADVDSMVWIGDGNARSIVKTQIVTHHVAEATMRAAVVALAKSPLPVTSSDPTAPLPVKIKAREATALEPSPGTVVFVPNGKMDLWTSALAGSDLKRHPATPKEAYLFRVIDPWRSFPDVPKTVTLGRLEVDARDDGGADVLMAGECTDAASAAKAAKLLDDTIKKLNVFPVRLMTKNVLDTAKVTQDGPRFLIRITATEAQVEALARIVADELNTDMAPAPTPATTAPPGKAKPAAAKPR